MARRLLDYDVTRGLTMEFEAMGDGTYAIHYSEDVEPVLDLNHAKRSEGRGCYASDPDMWKAASIPATIIMEWRRRYGIDVFNPDHTEGVRRLLNDPEWRYLKCAEIII